MRLDEGKQRIVIDCEGTTMSEVKCRIRATQREIGGPYTYEDCDVVFPCAPQVGWRVVMRSMFTSVFEQVRHKEHYIIEPKWEEVEYVITRIGTHMTGPWAGLLWLDVEEVP